MAIKLTPSQTYILKELNATFRLRGLKGTGGQREQAIVHAIDNPSRVFATNDSGTEQEALNDAIETARILGSVAPNPTSSEEQLQARIAEVEAKLASLNAAGPAIVDAEQTVSLSTKVEPPKAIPKKRGEATPDPNT